jgi:ubiquinone/menaquinone biosynthesis C-methylase UbiE
VTRTAYDSVARRYEARFANELSSKPKDRSLLDAFADRVTDPVLDVGCGPGQIGGYVRERGRRVVGLDLSHEMTKLAACRLDSAVLADLRALPVAAGSAGGVLAFYSLIHLPRTAIVAAFGELYRVLQPGGRVLVSAHEGGGEVTVDEFLDTPVQLTGTFFELDELTRYATSARFEVTHAERRAPYPSEGTTVRLYLELQRPATEDGPNAGSRGSPQRRQPR